MVNGVIVVGRVNKTTRDQAQALHAQLESLDAPVLGVVANRTSRGRATTATTDAVTDRDQMPRGLSAQTPSNALIGATLVSALAAAAGAAAAYTPTRLAVSVGRPTHPSDAGLIFFARPGLGRPRAGVALARTRLSRQGHLFPRRGQRVSGRLFAHAATPGRDRVPTWSFLGPSSVIGVCLADSSWKIREIVPGWLLGAAVLLLSAAILVALFPPGKPSQAALLFPGEILAHGGVARPNRALSNGGTAVRFVGTCNLHSLADGGDSKLGPSNSVWRMRGLPVLPLAELLRHIGISRHWRRGRPQLVGGVGGVPWEGGVRVSGLTTHSNASPTPSAMALPVAALRLGRTRGRVRIYFTVVVSVLIGAIVISGSRGGLIGGFLGLAFVDVDRFRARAGFKRTALFTAAVAVVVAVAVAPPSPP